MTDDIGKSVQRRLNVQVVEPLKQQNTALRKLCGEMVEQMKEHRCNYRATIIDVMNCNCDGCGTTQDLIHRYEQLEKGE